MGSSPEINVDVGTRLIDSVETIRTIVRDARAQGRTVGLVPTMGALHAGHLSLVAESIRRCDVTIATLFVNPTQFGPDEDFGSYPRTLAADMAKLREHGVDFVFAPSTETMYPAGHDTTVTVRGITDVLEGEHRPGHFQGVTTIVLKLFQIVPADIAFFGQKDYQQTRVVRQMTRDLDVPIEICVCPIVRDADGLALSSRNAYLSPEQRRQALALRRALLLAKKCVDEGVTDAQNIKAQVLQLLSDANIDQVDYVALVEPETMQAIDSVSETAVALIAAKVGTTRLIDNEILTAPNSHE